MNPPPSSIPTLDVPGEPRLGSAAPRPSRPSNRRQDPIDPAERPSSGPSTGPMSSMRPTSGPAAAAVDTIRPASETRPKIGRTSRPERQSDPMPASPDQAKPALNRLPKLPFELFLVLAVALLLLGAFAVMTQLSLSDARGETSAAADDLAAATAGSSGLEAANDDLAVANETLSNRIGELEQDVAAAEAAAEAAEDAANAAPALVEPDTTALDAEIERLQNENAALVADLESAEAAVAAGGDAPVASAETFESVEFTRWVGEILASEDGIRITGLQSICLANYVIEDIGFDAIGAGLNTSRSSASNDVVIQSMVAALAECGIEANRVFGS